jgi:hypothetical protein
MKTKLIGALAAALTMAGCTTAPSATEDKVAVVVIDNFSARPVVAQAVPPTANCPYVPEDTNEVGDSGAGDGLPFGVAHGTIVQSRLSAELTSLTGLTRLDPTSDLTPYNLYGLAGVSTQVGRWRQGSHEITVIGLDTNGFTTAALSARIQELIQRLKNGPRHITRVVLNMSFVIVPCNVPRWLREIGGFDGAAIRDAYWTLTGEHPELVDLRDELERLAANPAQRDARLLVPLPQDPLLPLQMRLAIGQFYGRTGAQGLPLAPEVLQRLNNDPLKPILAGLAASGVVPVGAAGNGVVVYNGTSLERTRFAFPFAPALWDSVVSVSAGQDAATRANYSNSGEVVMAGDTEVSRLDGTRVTVRGTSFAAPQVAARLGAYLLTGGPSPCDGHVPALGYADSDEPAPHWDDLTLQTAASRYCRSYVVR